MKTISLYLVFFLISLIISPARLFAQTVPPKADSGLNQIVADLEKTFPVVELFVIDKQEDKLLIENNKNVDLRSGMELGLFREGKEFTHPVTGIVLGRFEESLGEIKILEIKDAYCIAQPINLKPNIEVKRGDKARISSSRTKIALGRVPDQTPEIGTVLIDELIFKLEAGSRFEAISSGEFAAGLEKLGIDKNLSAFDKKQLQQIGQALGLRAVLLIKVKTLESANILETRLFSTVSGEVMVKSSGALEVNTAAPFVSQVPEPKQAASGFIVAAPAAFSDEEGVFKSNELGFAVKSLACADVNGDGKKEIVLSDGRQVRIYELANQQLNLLWTEKEAAHNHLSLDALDVNQNGKAEIFVTDYVSDAVKAYALEYNGQDFVPVYHWNSYFLRVLSAEGSQGKRLLIGQKSGATGIFSGKVEVLIWNKDKYIVQRELALPSGVNIYGFNQGDVNNDGKVETVSIDDHGRLHVYSEQGETIWKSSERHGGYDTAFYFKPKTVMTTTPGYAQGERVEIKGRIFLDDFNKNGMDEILLVNNISATGNLFPGSTVYNQGYMVAMEWDGIGYAKAWETKKLEAYIADFTVEDQNADGGQDLILALALAKDGDKLLSKEKKSLILIYDLQRFK
ncbi:MAG: VCBS repeat-containing protein [Candidatus Schekmanbacteria bacterium]|nr:VCBS repeat-containing protein [Candidatus Schekmanbacteria bacterium]